MLMLIKIQLALMVLQELILLIHQVIQLLLAKEIQAETLQTQQISITLLWTQTLLQVEEYQEEATIARLVQQR